MSDRRGDTGSGAELDAEQLSAWASGDERAGSELCKRYIDPLYRFFRNKVSVGSEDLVQRTLAGIVGARARFEGRSSFRSFVFGIARNVLLTAFRERNRLPQDPDFSTQSIEELAPSPSAQLAEHQERQRLLKAMRRIPVDYQIALELYYWEGLSGGELAQAVGISEPGVRSRLRRAKEAVRKELSAMCNSPIEVDSSFAELDVRRDQGLADA